MVLNDIIEQAAGRHSRASDHGGNLSTNQGGSTLQQISELTKQKKVCANNCRFRNRTETPPSPFIPMPIFAYSNHDGHSFANHHRWGPHNKSALLLHTLIETKKSFILHCTTTTMFSLFNFPNPTCFRCMCVSPYTLSLSLFDFPLSRDYLRFVVFCNVKLSLCFFFCFVVNRDI